VAGRCLGGTSARVILIFLYAICLSQVDSPTYSIPSIGCGSRQVKRGAAEEGVPRPTVTSPRRYCTKKAWKAAPAGRQLPGTFATMTSSCPFRSILRRELRWLPRTMR
jgi:hypothetical protein